MFKLHKKIRWAKKKCAYGSKLISLLLVVVGHFALAGDPLTISHLAGDNRGNTVSLGLDRSPRHGLKGIVVAFHKTDGLLKWDRRMEGTAELMVGDLFFDGFQIIVVGSFSDRIDLGSFVFEAIEGYDAFFAVYDLDGLLLNAGHLGGQEDILFTNLIQNGYGLTIAGEIAGIQFILPLNGYQESDFEWAREIDMGFHQVYFRNIDFTQTQAGSYLDWPDTATRSDLESNTIVDPSDSPADPNGDPPPIPD